MAGLVSVDGAPATKAGAQVAADASIDIREDDGFVSRGGQKLERALDAFGWDVTGLRCLDVGASTGGFTDCLLRRGAAAVTALDVGYGQLAWALRSDPRVTVIERANFRVIDPKTFGDPFDFVTIDVSFISLAKLASKLRAATRDGGRVVALVKPQFEAGRSAVGRGGVVRDAAAHIAAIGSVVTAFGAAGLAPSQLTFSPITGPAGNIEFLVGAVAGRASDRSIDAAGVVAAAHESLAR